MENQKKLEYNSIQHRRLDLLLSQSSSSISTGPERPFNLSLPSLFPQVIKKKPTETISLIEEENTQIWNFNANGLNPLHFLKQEPLKSDSNEINGHCRSKAHRENYFGDILTLASMGDIDNKVVEPCLSSNLLTSCETTTVAQQQSSENKSGSEVITPKLTDEITIGLAINTDVPISHPDIEISNFVLKNEFETDTIVEMSKSDQIGYNSKVSYKDSTKKRFNNDSSTFRNMNTLESKSNTPCNFPNSKTGIKILEDQNVSLHQEHINSHPTIKLETIDKKITPTAVSNHYSSENLLNNYNEVCRLVNTL